MTTSERTCTVCGDAESVHADRRIHPFIAPGNELPASMFNRKNRGEASQARVQLPFDPVLRQALLDRGILTIEDMKLAEQKVVAIMAATLSENVTGGADDGRRPEPR